MGLAALAVVWAAKRKETNANVVVIAERTVSKSFDLCFIFTPLLSVQRGSKKLKDLFQMSFNVSWYESARLLKSGVHTGKPPVYLNLKYNESHYLIQQRKRSVIEAQRSR
jgi:hypothetical protein